MPAAEMPTDRIGNVTIGRPIIGTNVMTAKNVVAAQRNRPRPWWAWRVGPGFEPANRSGVYDTARATVRNPDRARRKGQLP